MTESINIFSGEKGLGGALTNPTELAKSKGCILQSYPLIFRGRHWPDVETAYHVLGGDTPAQNDALMVDLISAKFKQHPSLASAVKERGGLPWLADCSHWTGARSEGAKAWEGQGIASRFIRNLVAGYEQSLIRETFEQGQSTLF